MVVWTAKGTSGTRLVTARSDDGGRSFGRETTVQGSDAAGNRGWEATAVDRDGRVAAIWLDHRELAETAASAAPMHHDGQDHSAHGAVADGASRAELSKLYFGFVDSPEAPRALTGGVCYCCKTALAAGADGSLYAAWRHVYPGNIRDIAFTLSRDGGRTFATPIRVSEDKWVLDGCPENGPAMAVGPQGRIHLVWPTLVSGTTAGSEPTLALFYSTSDDGRRFTARQRLATEGMPGHVQVALDPADGSLLVVWDELKDGTRRAVAARGVPDAAGQLQFVREQMAPAGSAYPVAVDDWRRIRARLDRHQPEAVRDHPSASALARTTSRPTSTITAEIQNSAGQFRLERDPLHALSRSSIHLHPVGTTRLRTVCVHAGRIARATGSQPPCFQRVVRFVP